MEAVRTSETSVDNHSTRQYNPEDSSEHHTRRRENLKSHMMIYLAYVREQHQSTLYVLLVCKVILPSVVSCIKYNNSELG
jgi:hypothetical protein